MGLNVMRILLMCVACAVIVHGQSGATRFRVMYEWNYINFTWPSEEMFRSAVSTSSYIPENNIISGIQYFDDYIYLTVPRMKDGVPATLTRMAANSYLNNTSPLLDPYPSWKQNSEGDCEALQNVQNVEIDTHGRMWILDVGRTRTMTRSPSIKCPPRLVIYDIRNNSTIKTYTFKESIIGRDCFPYDLVVDEVDGNYAYITDNSATDPGIIVYSVKLDKAWKIRDDYSMKAAPESVEFHVNGTALSAPINIAGIALGSQKTVNKDEEIISLDRIVYYCPLSSHNLFGISSEILRDERTKSIGNLVKNLGKKASQTDGMIMDEHGVLYYGLLSDSSIARWDSKTPFTSEQKVIARDRTHIQWPNSFAFDASGNVLVVTNKLQKFISNEIDIKEPNYRILSAFVNAKSYLFAGTAEIAQRNKTQGEVNAQGGTENMNSTLHYQIHSSPVNHWNKFKSNESHTEANSASISFTSFVLIISGLLLARVFN